MRQRVSWGSGFVTRKHERHTRQSQLHLSFPVVLVLLCFVAINLVSFSCEFLSSTSAEAEQDVSAAAATESDKRGRKKWKTERSEERRWKRRWMTSSRHDRRKEGADRRRRRRRKQGDITSRDVRRRDEMKKKEAQNLLPSGSIAIASRSLETERST